MYKLAFFSSDGDFFSLKEFVNICIPIVKDYFILLSFAYNVSVCVCLN